MHACMFHTRFIHSGLVVAGLSWSALAGATCPSTPTNWDAQDCVVDGGTVTVCTETSTSFTCDVSGAGGSSHVTVVTNYDTSQPLEAWGDYDGELFCCKTTAAWLGSAVYIYGSAYGDGLNFSTPSGAEYLMRQVGGANDVLTTAEIHGDAGNDQIKGSYEANTGFIEELYGEDDADTIYGNDGNDYIEGNDDADSLDGGAGDDEMWGGDGGDVMRGMAGEDLMYGEAGQDRMGGGDGDDQMNGGLDGDIICGDGEGANGDQLTDGDKDNELLPDKLWAAVSTDTDYCGASSTLWDGNASTSTPSSCASNSTLSTRPTQCP